MTAELNIQMQNDRYGGHLLRGFVTRSFSCAQPNVLRGLLSVVWCALKARLMCNSSVCLGPTARGLARRGSFSAKVGVENAVGNNLGLFQRLVEGVQKFNAGTKRIPIIEAEAAAELFFLVFGSHIFLSVRLQVHSWRRLYNLTTAYVMQILFSRTCVSH